MLFSIIIATLNSEKTIAKTLDSISEQICNDFEVIIIDGLSEDNTLDIIINHKLNIRLITEKDSGIYDALNKGIKLALGDWIYIMGSDDIFYNQEVLSSVSRDLREDLGMVYGNILARNSNIEKLILMRHPDAYKKMGIFSPPIFHQSVFMFLPITLFY
jgi:glycosyltransferase involved in cell wall biosynthesis